jgi:GWxTD domain-containing protein
LLFYHPAVWWISGKVRAERENCCDDAVVVLTGDARGYAVALTAFEEKRWAAEAAMAANGGHLIRRIHRLLKPERPTVPAAPIVGLLLASACLAMAAWKPLPSRIPPLQVAAGPGAAQAQALARQLESPYEKWLWEDVAYIITEPERAAFQRLQADAEREKFIEQFWLRRDPTPDTPRNEYKEEHYRRIAYTNDNFGFVDTAGWRTDRGRIYIMFGPPDEREVHEKGGVSTQGRPVTLPFEIWRYRFIDGVGRDVYMEFVDAAHRGDYRMTRDPAAPAPK